MKITGLGVFALTITTGPGHPAGRVSPIRKRKPQSLRPDDARRNDTLEMKFLEPSAVKPPENICLSPSPDL